MRFYQDLSIDDTFAFGPRTVNTADIVEFAERYDPQPIHVDEAAATESMFGGLIASGWHTASLCVGMVADEVFEDIAALAGRGVDDLRWHQPVRPGDSLSGTITVISKRPPKSSPGRGYVDFRTTVNNQNDATVLSMTNLGMVRMYAENTTGT